MVVAGIPRRMVLEYASLGSTLLARKTRWRAWELRLWGQLEMETDGQRLDRDTLQATEIGRYVWRGARWGRVD